MSGCNPALSISALQLLLRTEHKIILYLFVLDSVVSIGPLSPKSYTVKFLTAGISASVRRCLFQPHRSQTAVTVLVDFNNFQHLFIFSMYPSLSLLGFNSNRSVDLIP